MRPLVRTTFVLLALSAVAGAAAAAPRILQAGISNMQMRVIDLTPADGAAAGFAVNGFATSLTGAILEPSEYWTAPRETIDVPGGTAHTLHLEEDGRNASVSVAASAGTMALSYTLPPEARSGRDVVMLGVQQVKITLKAHSMLIVDAYAYSTTSGWDNLWPVYSAMALQLSGGAGDPTTRASMAHLENGYVFGRNELQLSYVNVSDQDMSLSLGVQAYATVSSVPEPSTGAMLAAGFAAIGYAARRRRTIKTPHNQQGEA